MKFIHYFVPLFLISVAIAQNNKCGFGFYSVDAFKAYGIQRPEYLENSAQSSDLSFCKGFNNKDSCCNKKTDDQIKNILSNYKNIISSLTTKKIKNIRGPFKGFKSLSLPDDIPNANDVKSSVDKIYEGIDLKWTNATKHLVSCLKAAYKLSVGLLCGGCSVGNETFLKTGYKIGLQKQACLSVSSNCYKLIQSFSNVSNSSMDDAMAMTDAITEYIGEDLPIDQGNEGNVFGDLNDTDSNKRFLANDRNPKTMEKKKDVEVDATYIDGLCKEITTKFAESTCVICLLDSTNADCPNNKFRKMVTKIDELVTFSQKSEWGIRAAIVKIPITSKKTASDTTTSKNTLILNFVFTNKNLNKNLWDFIALKNTPFDAKEGKINALENTIEAKLKYFLNWNSKFSTKSAVAKKDLAKSYSNKVLPCVVKILVAAAKEGGKNIYQDDFEFSFDLTAKTSKIGTTALKGDYDVQLDKCYATKENEKTPISKIEGACKDKACTICLDENCFDQQFNFAKISDKAKREYSKDKGRDQYKADKTISLKTGKKVPDFVELPPVNNLTDFKFEAPCIGLENCSIWFCTKFLKGPVVRLEKIYNPQNSSGDMDTEATKLYTDLSPTEIKSNTVGRILQTAEAEYEISDNGFNFNQVADVSAISLDFEIDGVKDASVPYDVGTNSGNPANPNFGILNIFSLASLAVLALIFSF